MIIGLERGGAFLGEVLTYADPALAAKLTKLPKFPPPKGGKYKFDHNAMQNAFRRMIDSGKKNFALVDAYMGGRTARDLRDGVFKPLAAQHEGVSFEIYWLRETFGFETRGTGGEGLTLTRPQGTLGSRSPYASQIKTRYQEIRLVLGDDMNIVFTPGAREPIRIFDKSGKVIQTYEPRQGETTRQLLIRLMNGDVGN